MRVAVLQSNYIPWKGYFDIIRAVDLFIFYDDVQFTKNDWRNRNRIKTPNGVQWLTIPVGQDIDRRIDQVILPKNESWRRKHWSTLCHCYGKTAHFSRYAPLIAPFFEPGVCTTLSEFNQRLVKTIATEILGAATEFRASTEYPLSGTGSSRLLTLLDQVGCTQYRSGPAATAYLDETAFAAAGIQVEYQDYLGYPEYPQLFPPFEHAVTILDLIFNCGPQADRFMQAHPR